LSRLLSGEIRLSSNPGKGSTFTLYLPRVYVPPRTPRKPFPPEPPPAPTNGDVHPAVQPVAGPEERTPPRMVNAADDHPVVMQPGDQVLLIVENDLGFARFLLDAAREKGFKGLVSPLGAGALAMASEYRPAVITLDIFLPDIDGWRVLERLKHDLGTRHIPVCVVSTEEARDRALNDGALAFVAKPIQTRALLDRLLDELKAFVDRPVRGLLVVEPDARRRERILEALPDGDFDVRVAADGPAALRAVRDGGA